MKTLTLDRINSFSESEFIEELGGLFEHSPWIAAATWPLRPFSALEQLHEGLCRNLQAASDVQHLALIRAHPDLVGKAARSGHLTAASTQEQSAAGLSQLTPEEIALFDEWNQKYQDRFGFPFIICSRLNKKDAILNGFHNRIHHSREEEFAAALREIETIAWFRLSDRVAK